MNSILAALINGAILSAPLAAATWLVLRLLPRRSMNAATRHLVWWGTLAVVVALPAVYIPVPHFGQPHTSRVVSHAPLTPLTTSAQPPAPLVRTTSISVDALPKSVFPVELPAGSWMWWIAAAWGSATLLMFGRLVVSVHGVKRRKARALPAATCLAERVPSWLAQCGCNRHVRLAGSEEITTPMAAGLGDPCILIPARLFAELQETELDQIGLHEAAHLARRDDYALILQRVIEALFVLHPVVHWITRRIELEREIACDDFVVQATGNPRTYASCLTHVVELAGAGPAALVTVAATDERSNLSKRVDMLLDGTRHTGTGLLKGRLLAAIASLLLLVSLAARMPGVIAFAMPIPQQPPVARPVPLPAPVEEAVVGPQQPAATRNRTATAIHVEIPVSITDPLNRFVTGLGKENFRLLEDGEAQEISQFSAAGTPPDMLGFFWRVGDRVPGANDAVGDALAQFQDFVGAPPGSDLSTRHAPARPIFDPAFDSAVEEYRRRMGPIRHTSILESLTGLTRSRLPRNGPGGAILLFSDGSDVVPYTDAELKRALPDTDVPIYIIGIEEPPEATQLFDRIAAETGGQHVAVNKVEDLPAVVTKLAVHVRNTYVLGFTPKHQAHDGSFHSVQVEVLAPRGLPPLKTSYRGGYYAPLK